MKRSRVVAWTALLFTIAALAMFAVSLITLLTGNQSEPRRGVVPVEAVEPTMPAPAPVEAAPVRTPAPSSSSVPAFGLFGGRASVKPAAQPSSAVAPLPEAAASAPSSGRLLTHENVRMVIGSPETVTRAVAESMQEGFYPVSTNYWHEGSQDCVLVLLVKEALNGDD